MPGQQPVRRFVVFYVVLAAISAAVVSAHGAVMTPAIASDANVLVRD